MTAKKLVVSKWKMVSPTAFLWKEKRRFVKPGEILTSKEEDLPVGLKPLLVPIVEKPQVVRTKPSIVTAKVEEVPVEQPIVEEKPSYYWIKARMDGTFDVFSRVGKKMNEEPLESHEAAEKLRKTLE